ncbi:MAG: hypothetical protein Q4B28_05990 [bacterium]|nr:hypothetical protein [bacterium]
MLVNLIVVPLVPLISIGGSIALLLITRTGWSGRILPIKWLLSFIYLCSDRAQQFSITMKIQNSRMQWIISILLISIIILLAYQLKQHPPQHNSQ